MTDVKRCTSRPPYKPVSIEPVLKPPGVNALNRFRKVPVRYRPNAASGGWSYGRGLVHS